MAADGSVSVAALSPGTGAKSETQHQDVAPQIHHEASQTHHTALAKPAGQAHKVIKHSLKSRRAKGHTRSFTAAIMTDHKPTHRVGGHKVGGKRAGNSSSQTTKPAHHATRLVTLHEPSLITSHRARKDASTSRTYRVAGASYRVRYVERGTGSYAVIQPLSTGSRSAARSMLSGTAGYPAALLATIGKVLASLARTGGGGFGMLAGLPLPVQTILLGLMLTGLGILLRGMAFATRLVRAPSLAGAPVGAESEIPAE